KATTSLASPIAGSLPKQKGAPTCGAPRRTRSAGRAGSRPAAVMGGHHFAPRPVRLLHTAGELAIILVDDRDDVLIARRLPRPLEVRAGAVEGQHLAGLVERALIDPQVGHHRADPGADVALLLRIVAERQQGLDGTTAGHVAAAFADEP